MKDLTVSRPFNEDEYKELLRQAVAVIETSRLSAREPDAPNFALIATTFLSARISTSYEATPGKIIMTYL